MRSIKLLAAIPFLLVFGVIYLLLGGWKEGGHLSRPLPDPTPPRSRRCCGTHG